MPAPSRRANQRENRFNSSPEGQRVPNEREQSGALGRRKLGSIKRCVGVEIGRLEFGFDDRCVFLLVERSLQVVVSRCKGFQVKNPDKLPRIQRSALVSIAGYENGGGCRLRFIEIERAVVIQIERLQRRILRLNWRASGAEQTAPAMNCTAARGICMATPGRKPTPARLACSYTSVRNRLLRLREAMATY